MMFFISYVESHLNGKIYRTPGGGMASLYEAVLRQSLVSVRLDYMGESFQDHSWIQDFETDFPQKVSLKILN